MPTGQNSIRNEIFNRGRVFWFLALVAIAVIAVVLVGVLRSEGSWLRIFYGKPHINSELPKGYEFVSANTGELPAGFPKELVLFEDAKILGGESTVDGTGIGHKITEYSISQSSADVVVQYQSKLPALGWKLSDGPISQKTLQILNFTKGQTTLIVIISFKTATSSQVSLDVKEGK